MKKLILSLTALIFVISASLAMATETPATAPATVKKEECKCGTEKEKKDGKDVCTPCPEDKKVEKKEDKKEEVKEVK